jgi:hypothetical protein
LDAISNYKNNKNESRENKEAASPCWSPSATLRRTRLEIFRLPRMAVDSREVPVVAKNGLKLISPALPHPRKRTGG